MLLAGQVLDVAVVDHPRDEEEPVVILVTRRREDGAGSRRMAALPSNKEFMMNRQSDGIMDEEEVVFNKIMDQPGTEEYRTSNGTQYSTHNQSTERDTMVQLEERRQNKIEMEESNQPNKRR